MDEKAETGNRKRLLFHTLFECLSMVEGAFFSRIFHIQFSMMCTVLLTRQTSHNDKHTTRKGTKLFLNKAKILSIIILK